MNFEEMVEYFKKMNTSNTWFIIDDVSESTLSSSSAPSKPNNSYDIIFN